MKKNGFTLIELLAVIVILAIIALIATPIIIGIINDARKESNERSAELYASAVRNAIAAYQLTNTNAPKSFGDLNIQYDREVECAKKELYEDGSFYIAECTVNGDAVDYTYGEKQYVQVYKPQYYSWVGGSIGDDLPSDAKTIASKLIPNSPVYLGIDVDNNNKISEMYVCFERSGKEYCLKGLDSEAFAINKVILEEVAVNDECSLIGNEFTCTSDPLYITMYPVGDVTVSDNVSSYCEALDGYWGWCQ